MDKNTKTNRQVSIHSYSHFQWSNKWYQSNIILWELTLRKKKAGDRKNPLESMEFRDGLGYDTLFHHPLDWEDLLIRRQDEDLFIDGY